MADSIATVDIPQDIRYANRKPRHQSYQVRALVRKTISYQKRQRITNLCCVSACPILMVTISALLGTLLTSIISESIKRQEFVSCSNENAFDQDTNLPITSSGLIPVIDGQQIPGATPGLLVKQLNFYISSSLSDTGNVLDSTRASCVLWTRPDYTNSDPYERDPFAPPLPQTLQQFFNAQTITGQFSRRFARSSSIYEPDPRYGWLNPVLSTSPDFLIGLSTKQQFPWAFVVEPQGVNLGSKQKKPGFILNDATLRVPFMDQGDDGVLGQFRTQYYSNIIAGSSLTDPVPQSDSYQPVPFFNKLVSTNPAKSDQQVDDMMRNLIKQTFTKLSAIDRRTLLGSDPTPSDQIAFLFNISAITNEVPWGTLHVREWNTTTRQFHYVWQIGYDSRLARSSSYPTQGFRRFLMNAMFSSSLLQQLVPGNSIVQGLRIFPSLISTSVNLPIGSIIGRILFPFGVSFLLPIFVIILVQEKEARIHVMMKMNGLKAETYFLAHFLHFFFLHVLSSVFFLISGTAFQLRFFTLTSPMVLIVLFFFWGLVQIALSFFIAAFFSHTRNALVMSFLSVLLSVLISMASDRLFSGEAPSLYLLWPPFAFYRSISLINRASFQLSSRSYTLAALSGTDEVLRCLKFMIGEVFLYSSLAFYFSTVLPSEYGVRKPWYYVVSEPWQYFKQKQGWYKNPTEAENVDIDPDEILLEDQDVKAERDRVDANLNLSDSLVIRHMRKTYGSGKVAVKDVTLATENGEIFGLLGPNGAGKTTLISILTGLYEPTSGSATLGGYDVLSDRQHVYRITGICPQHDILWDDLSVGEHILFYARLKGISPEEEEEAKRKVLEAVSLQAFEDRLAKGLSGGEKRRLSIGIALTGSPKVVFLDEPSTGLDPELRRHIWKIITEARVGKTIVLTTHSMEEAEVLCSRIAIMNQGILRCLGHQHRLKKLYGSGFKLTFICKPEHMPNATSNILDILPANAKVLDAFEHTKSIEFIPGEGELAKIFELLLEKSSEYLIQDWGVSATSLEEVFLRIISDNDAEGT